MLPKEKQRTFESDKRIEKETIPHSYKSSQLKKLNDALEGVNDRTQRINENNNELVHLSQFWMNYSRNVAFNLESMQKLQEQDSKNTNK
ncbi:24809_t:CDS:2 [Entrophospora sp. SA101]|nr:24809_t:CDS:2 [Entrophospora sp. SA101]CAJ0922178.1 15553_t:CDS:2 [Entrophospora sp. SA101]